MSNQNKPFILLLLLCILWCSCCFAQPQINTLPCNTHYPADFSINFNACNQFQVDFSENCLYGTSFTWDFGDGSAAVTGQNVSHVYAREKNYIVQLIAKNTAGCRDTVKKQFVLKISRWNIFPTNDTNYCKDYSFNLPGDSNATVNCWSPATYLSATNIYNPVCKPKQNITYTYNRVKRAGNLIPNGNFAQGNIGFSSNYNYSNIINSSGNYYITDNPNQWNNAYINCIDPLLRDSAMVVNGTTLPGVIVWSNTITVQAQTNYEFSFGMQPLTQNDSVILEVDLNNGQQKVLAFIQDMPCTRKKFITSWFSGSTTTLNIKLVDLNINGVQNNFLLDNFSLRKIFVESDTFSVQLKLPAAVATSNDTTICPGDSAKLFVFQQGAASFRWSPPIYLTRIFAQNTIASPLSTTKYFITVTDSNHCISLDSVNVNILPAPIVSSIVDTSLCLGSSIVLQTNIVGAISFNWTPPTGLNNALLLSPTATPSSPIQYICTATDGICSTKDSVSINIFPNPITSLTNDTLICERGQVQLIATGGSNYIWNPVLGLSNATISNPIAKPLANTRWYVDITDVNGCKANDSILVTVKKLPTFKLQPASTSICAGDSILLQATGGDIYAWHPSVSVLQPSSAVTKAFPKNTTIYKAVITSNECQYTDSIFTTIYVKPKPIITLTKSNDIDCAITQATLSATGGIQYTWWPMEYLSNTNIANPVATPYNTTTYHATILGANNCWGEDSIKVIVTRGEIVNGYPVPNAFTPNGDGLNDCFGISKWGGVNNLQFNIYNRWGNLVFTTTNALECWDGRYKNILQPAGAYTYIINGRAICGKVDRKGLVMLIR